MKLRRLVSAGGNYSNEWAYSAESVAQSLAVAARQRLPQRVLINSTKLAGDIVKRLGVELGDEVELPLFVVSVEARIYPRLKGNPLKGKARTEPVAERFIAIVNVRFGADP